MAARGAAGAASPERDQHAPGLREFILGTVPESATLVDLLEPVDLWRLAQTCRAAKPLIAEDARHWQRHVRLWPVLAAQDELGPVELHRVLARLRRKPCVRLSAAAEAAAGAEAPRRSPVSALSCVGASVPVLGLASGAVSIPRELYARAVRAGAPVAAAALAGTVATATATAAAAGADTEAGTDTFDLHAGSIRHIQVLPSGRIFVAAWSGGIFRVDPCAGAPHWRSSPVVQTHHAPAAGVRVLRDGRHVIVAAGDGSLELHRISADRADCGVGSAVGSAATLVSRTQAHGGAVNDIGIMLASADATTPAPTRRAGDSAGDHHSGTPHGQEQVPPRAPRTVPILCSCGVDGAVVTWEADTAAGAFRRLSACPAHRGPAWTVQALPSFHTLSGGADGDVVLACARTGREVWRSHLPRRQAACLQVVGTAALVGTMGSCLHCLDMRDGHILWTVRVFPGREGLQRIAVEPVRGLVYCVSAFGDLAVLRIAAADEEPAADLAVGAGARAGTGARAGAGAGAGIRVGAGPGLQG